MLRRFPGVRGNVRHRENSAVGFAVRLDDIGLDPTPLADLVAVVAGPLPDLCDVVVTGRYRLAAGTRSAARILAGNRDKRLKRIAQLQYMWCGKINFIADAVQAEADSFIGGATVEIINLNNVYPLCHGRTPDANQNLDE